MSPVAAVLLALLSAREGRLREVRVTASDGGGTADQALARELTQALADVNLPAGAPGATSACRDDCLDVSVRRTSPDQFLVEVRSHRKAAEASVQLAPLASPFDRAHALAVQIELLADRTQTPRRRRAPVVIAARDPDPPVLVAMEEPEEIPLAPPPALPAPPPVVAVVATPEPQVADERLALNVAGTSLVGTSGGLLMHGAAVGLRIHLGRRIDLRAALSLLRPQRVRTEGSFLRRELLPLQLSAMLPFPRLPSFRLGGGVEALAVSADSEHREVPSAWSLGALGRGEYRHPIRAFAFLAAVQVAYHHPSWVALGDGNPLFVVPPWTVTAALGLEFRVL
jgi:hypothetical protein